MRVLTALVCSAVLVAACGGSSGQPGGVGTSFKITASDMRYITTSGTSVDLLETVSVGDDELDRRWVIVVQFDISGLNVTEQVELFLHHQQFNTAGTPFSDLGPPVIDHIDGGLQIIDTHFGGFTLESGFWNLGNQPAYSINVSAQVQADKLAGRSTSTYRLRFDPPSDGNGDYDQLRFSTHLASFEPNRPALIITEGP